MMNQPGTMNEAVYYEKQDHSLVRCLLCPHLCLIKPGQQGICRVRINDRGTLLSATYGKVSALHSDPIEKKPLYHFYPGRSIVSIGSVGCNLQCSFCQNWQISQACLEDTSGLRTFSPAGIAAMANGGDDNIGIAYTYNEPVVFYEFMLDIARLVRKAGKKNVMVTNGFISSSPLQELLPVMDAFNIDLKAFDDNFYRKYTHSRLDPVKETLRMVAASGSHLELTNLLIPGLNDDRKVFGQMAEWIAAELGEEVVLHLSRYFPQYKMDTAYTPEQTLKECYEIASASLKYVYLGNFHGDHPGQHTHCPVCHRLLIDRQGYHTRIRGLDSRGNCSGCGEKIMENI